MRADLSTRGRSLTSSVKMLSHMRVNDDLPVVDAEGMSYRELNALLRRLAGNLIKSVEVHGVYGQRYIGTSLGSDVKIKIFGTPGNDLGAFMNGPSISVHGNVQDGCGNTMSAGLIVVHGQAGDVAGYSMMGGKIFIRDDVGYRAGIHMKECKDLRPFMVIGGSAGDFLGEYMAGGTILLLGLNMKNGWCHKTRFAGAGMHGGVIYIRGKMTHLGKEVEVLDIDKCDVQLIRGLVSEFCEHFNTDFDEIMSNRFVKIVPVSHRPYGGLYAY